jgi:hypothetical protein
MRTPGSAALLSNRFCSSVKLPPKESHSRKVLSAEHDKIRVAMFFMNGVESMHVTGPMCAVRVLCRPKEEAFQICICPPLKARMSHEPSDVNIKLVGRSSCMIEQDRPGMLARQPAA